MYEAQTWRVRPGEPFTFGRAPDFTRRTACGRSGRVAQRRESASTTGGGGCTTTAFSRCIITRGFRADLPPAQVPLQQWHAKVTVNGTLGNYTPRLRRPISTMCLIPGWAAGDWGELAGTAQPQPAVADR
jgi:hypothetical protein